jgi:hypothetical protein
MPSVTDFNQGYRKTCAIVEMEMLMPETSRKYIDEPDKSMKFYKGMIEKNVRGFYRL